MDIKQNCNQNPPMIIDKDNNIIFFDNDTVFYDYCVNPTIKGKEFVLPNGKKRCFAYYDFTQEYNDAINNNSKFVICDPHSKICKHGCVNYRTITRPVCNVELYDPKLYPHYTQICDEYNKQCECCECEQ